MSRIGKMPVSLPAGVEVKVSDDNSVVVKGPKGELQEKISKQIKVENIDGKVVLSCKSEGNGAKAAYGLYRSLINNMVEGVTKGFEKKLIITGVGFRAEKQGKSLIMQLGYSHPVEMEDPVGIETEVTSPTEIVVKGIDKALVGNYAANIRAKRPTEPYKGKGIRYENEVVRRKEGKAGAK
ncbi:MAG: 50S ribosomal protein L6 [Clostridiales bacterium]|jgi:large subunit ribosomal protein L6|nr:50S ribosomal protein L6 [Clostridiales bacterium]